MRSFSTFVLVVILVLAGCTQPAADTPTPILTPITSATATPTPTAEPSSTSTPTPSATSTPTPTPTPSPTPTPPQMLKVVGQIGGPTQAVAVQGRYAYVGVGLRLSVLDITNPANPMEVGATEPFGWYVEDVVVVGSTAFVAAGGAGLYIVDVSDPTHPTVLGNYDTPGYAEDVVVGGKYAYIADGPAGLWVVDIGDLAHPAEVGWASSLNYAFDVAVEGGYAFIAAAGAGLLVADISDPTKPREIGSLDTPGYAYGIAVVGSVAYVADGWGGLRVVNVSIPTQPRETGFYDTPGWAFDVAAKESIAYVADGWGGVHLLDVKDPTKIAGIGSYHPAGGIVVGLVVDGKALYVADPYLGFRIIDVADPRTLHEVGYYAPLSFAGRVALASGHAFVTGVHGSFKAFRIVDVSEPSRPLQVGAMSALTDPYAVEAAGNLAYVLAGVQADGVPREALYILDISDEMKPRLISHQGTIAPGVSVVLRDGIAYITTEWSFELVDISDPSAPSKLAVLDFTGGLGRAAGASVVNDVALSGTVAYATDSDRGLIVIDVTNPASPRVIISYKPPEILKPKSIVIAGTYAFLGDHGHLVVVDISNPGAPSVAANVPLPGIAEDLALEGNLLYVAAGPEGLHVLDVANPRHPVLVASQWLPGRSYDVTTDAGYVYVSSGEAGMFVLQRPGAAFTGPRTSSARYDFTSGSVAADPVFSRETVPVPLPSAVIRSTALEVATEQVASRWDTNLGQDSALQPSSSVSPGSRQTWTVTSAADSGPGSLRSALESARGGDAISFDPVVFPPERPTTIQVASALPYLSQGTLTVDASNAGVILDGSRAPEGTHGIVITSDYNIIKGLQVRRFPGAGIAIGGGAFNTIGGDRGRGTGPSGEGNTISENRLVGVGLGPCVAAAASYSDMGKCKSQGKSGNNRVIGNYIGPNISGTQAVGSQGTGVWVWGTTHNIIGGPTPADRNIISGNTRAGITFMGASRNIIAGNYIGTNASGTKALGNKINGVSIESGAANVVARNVISGNSQAGVLISDINAFGNEVVGNLIGTDATGTIALGNGQGIGVNEAFNRIGGTVPEERNVISGNLGLGVKIGWQSVKGVVVLGNYIGTDVTGTRVLGNGSDGVQLTEGTYHNFIGGSIQVARNVISGNQGKGINLQGTGVRYNFVAGNYVGTASDGSTAVPNQSGIAFQGAGYNFVQANLVASNRDAGISIQSGAGNRIHHNRLMNNGNENCNASDRGRDNRWDDGWQGNYWSDYKGSDGNGNGIGDTPHPVPPNGVDRYPLMKPQEGVSE